MIDISISGVSGRMGRAVLGLALGDPRYRVVEALVSPRSPLLGKNLYQTLTPREGETLLISEVHRLGRVVIDFSTPAALRARLEECLAVGSAIVSGTTGLGDADHAALRAAARGIPVLHAANFSIGVMVLKALARQATARLPEYDVEIAEFHHRRKVDAPSGTAKALLDEIGKERAGARQRHGREGQVGPRASGEIGVHAIRGGDVIGEHTIFFAGDGERIELTHRASSRDAFAAGALRAALFLAEQKAGLYTAKQALLPDIGF